MKPQLSQDEEHALLRKLVYVKWLWLRGAQDAERNDELSHMSAILAFHNAIEMVIQNIIISHKYAQSASLKNTKFAGLIEMIGELSAVQPRRARVAAVYQNSKGARTSER